MESTNKQNKIKRSNTKLVLIQAKLQYLPSIGADLSLKRGSYFRLEKKASVTSCENGVIQIAG